MSTDENIIELNNTIMQAIESAVMSGVPVKQIDAAIISLGYTPNEDVEEERMEYKQLLIDFKRAMESVIRDCNSLRPDMAKMRAEDMLKGYLARVEQNMDERHGESI